jgi:mediator of RNA polymerase II transcription subunit 19
MDFDHVCTLSSLRSVIEKPPIGGKELLPLNSLQLSGFRLHPGPVSVS